MKSSKLLAVHPGFARLSVGVLAEDRWLWKDSAEGTVLKALFSLLERLRKEAGVIPGELGGVLLSRGPAPALGLRVAGSFYRTLRVVLGVDSFWSYSSLELAAARLVKEGVNPPFRVWAPAGRGQWRVLAVTDANPPWVEEVRGVGPGEGEADVVLEHPKSSPAGVRIVPDDLESLAEVRGRFPMLIRPGLGEWDEMALRTASYRRWAGDRHRKESGLSR